MYLGLTPWDNVLGQRLRAASWGEILGGSLPKPGQPEGSLVSRRIVPRGHHTIEGSPNQVGYWVPLSVTFWLLILPRYPPRGYSRRPSAPQPRYQPES